MNAIELKDVNYRSNAFQLQDVSFNVPKGYVTGFIGGNGAGKTTIIRLIMDLIQSESGTISVFEKDIKIHPREIKNKIGFVYSEIYFNQKWTVKKLENIIAPFYDRWDHDKIVSGSNEDLDEELDELLIYKESKQTGYIGLTEYYQTFNELFGSGVEIKDASIEQLMIYLEKSKHKRNTNSKYKVRFNYEAIND